MISQSPVRNPGKSGSTAGDLSDESSRSSNALLHNDDDITDLTELVLSIKLRKDAKGCALCISTTTSTGAAKRSEHGLTVIVKSMNHAHQITKVNPLKVRDKLESITPG